MIRRPPRSTLFPDTTLFQPLAADGKCNKKGLPNPLQLAVIGREFDKEGYLARPPLPIQRTLFGALAPIGDRKSTRLNSSHANISYAVFCLKKKTKIDTDNVL